MSTLSKRSNNEVSLPTFKNNWARSSSSSSSPFSSHIHAHIYEKSNNLPDGKHDGVDCSISMKVEPLEPVFLAGGTDEKVTEPGRLKCYCIAAANNPTSI